MIIITSIYDFDNYDAIVKYAIMRSVKGNYIQLSSLAPSRELFLDYLTWKKNGCWNENWFNTYYVPRFLQDLYMDSNAKKDLNALYLKSKKFDIVLGCCCHSEELCHRSIIAGLLQAVGCEVYTPTGKDYTKYYNLYKQLVISNV